MRVILIGAGGFLGAISRYLVEGWVSDRTKSSFPWGTLVVNITGCFLLGFVFVLLTERFVVHAHFRPTLAIGFVGAYTTFSTFAFETMQLAETGAFLYAAANLVGSVSAGLIAVYVGTLIGRAL